MIAPRPTLLLLLVALALMASQAQAVSSSQVGHLLMENYDDGSEMNQKIILDFMSSELCQQQCPRYERDGLLNSFEQFRAEWVDRMVSFVIGELGIDAETARHVRRNPANYKVNYETYKLLEFK